MYKANFKSSDFISIKAEPTEKLGEITADKDSKIIRFEPVNKSDDTIIRLSTLIPEYGSDYVELKPNESMVSSYDQISDSANGIGVWFQFESPKYPVTVTTENGTFRTWNPVNGKGIAKNVGKSYEVGVIGAVSWLPDDLKIPDDFEAVIQVKGDDNGKSVDLGTLVITKNPKSGEGVFCVTLKKSDKLRRRTDFEAARLDGVKEVGTFLLLVHLPASRVECGVICSKKYSLLSVERNRARRLLWEGFRLLKPQILPSRLVLIARNRLKGCKSPQVRQELEQLLKRAGLWKA